MNGSNGENLGTNLRSLTNQELMKLYDQYEMDSPAYASVKAEMVRRGFSFQEQGSTPSGGQSGGMPHPEINNQNNPFASVQAVRLRYSKGWSLFWEILFLVLGLLGFTAAILAKEGEAETLEIVLYALGACNIFTVGALVSGVRNLANHKSRLPEATRSGAWQIFLGVIWGLTGVGALYYGFKSFREASDWNEEAATIIAGVTLILSLFCAAYATILITLGREIGSAD